jgi:hypothetical protein
MAVFKPKNVELIDPADFTRQRQLIFDKVHQAVKARFPAEYGGVRAELVDSGYEGPDTFSPEEQTQALLNDKYLSRKLKGTVNLYDARTNTLLDQRKLTLMNVPWLSDRGTFLHNGSDYSSIKQLRLVSGPFSRFMDNGQIEVHFNVKPGSGPGYRVRLEPDTGQMRLCVGAGSEIHLYSLLKDMGVPDDKLRKTWGSGTFDMNASKYNPRALQQAYTKLVPKKEQLPDADRDTQASQLRKAFDRSQVLSTVMNEHLGSVKSASLQKALQTEPDFEFKPDFTPDQLREETNAIYGKHGPRLASMSAWPDKWINKDVDPLGWLEWYGNYHAGRRTDDDERQIRRWLSMRARHGSQFVNNPTPRRAFALRNWGIDALQMLPPDQRAGMQQAMNDYRTRAWADWTAKRAALAVSDLQAIAEYLNTTGKAGINVQGTEDELENGIRDFFFSNPQQQEAQALQGASEASTPPPPVPTSTAPVQTDDEPAPSPDDQLKAACLAHLALRPWSGVELEQTDTDRILVKYAGKTQDCTGAAYHLLSVLSCQSS